MILINENSMLTYCTQTDLSENAKERIRHFLERPLQWQKVTELAVSEKIAPLIYHSLKEFSSSGLVPEDTLNTLQQMYYQNLGRNMHLFTELSRVLDVFREHNVDVMVLKGAALADTVYGDIGLRSMADIDLLVREKDLSRSKLVMASLNYEVTRAHPEEWYRKKHFHLPPFFNREKSIGIEVHWNIAGRAYSVDIDKWWKRTVSTTLNNTAALVPSPEDMLLHQCIHLHHQMYGTHILKRSICDFSGILRYYEGTVNLDMFCREADLCGLTRTAHAILYLVNKYFAPVSSPVLAVSPGDSDMKFIRILEDRLLASSDFPGPFIHYFAAEGAWNRACTLFRAVFPARDVMEQTYATPATSKKLYIYYFIRPVSLLLRYRRNVFAIVDRKMEAGG